MMYVMVERVNFGVRWNFVFASHSTLHFLDRTGTAKVSLVTCATFHRKFVWPIRL